LITTSGFAPASSALRSTKTGLRLRASAASTTSSHAIDHIHDALDLAAEIGVSWVSTMFMWKS